jgi:CDP-diacylglycerol---glycerol-3-phosphate 3-phosphatidyltransferase
VINQRIRGLYDGLMKPVGRSLSRLGLSADAITLIGVAIQGLAAYFIVQGRLFVAGLVAIVAAVADGLDGAVAKARGSTSKFGALLDSSADRLSDALFFVPVAWLFLEGDRVGAGQQWIAALALCALVASFLVSYIKARAEGLGYSCDVGIIERAERLLFVIVALLLAEFIPAAVPISLGALAVLSSVTVVQRLMHVRAQTRSVT